MKRILLAAALLAASSPFAFAADAVVEEPVPVAVDVFSWSGAYVGGHIGYGWGDTDLTVDIIAPQIAPGGAAAADDINIFDDGEDSYDIDGIFGGVQAGYNWQVNQFVFGAEADFSFADINGEGYDPQADTTFSTDIDWFGTVRARAGFAVDRTLIYATGGFAYGHVENTVTGGRGAPFPGVFSEDDTSTGWTAGGGVEHAFTDHLTVKAEYLFVDLGDQTLSDPDVGATAEFDNSFHTVRLGFNYKF